MSRVLQVRFLLQRSPSTLLVRYTSLANFKIPAAPVESADSTEELVTILMAIFLLPNTIVQELEYGQLRMVEAPERLARQLP